MTDGRRERIPKVAVGADADLTTWAGSIEQTSRALLAVTVDALEAVSSAVSPTQVRALMAVAGAGSASVSDIAEALAVLPSSASRLADRMVAAGLIRRSDSPDDRRTVLLTLTARGSRVLQQVTGHRYRAIAQVASLMTANERKQLLTGLLAFDRAHSDAASGLSGRRGRSDPIAAAPRPADHEGRA